MQSKRTALMLCLIWAMAHGAENISEVDSSHASDTVSFPPEPPRPTPNTSTPSPVTTTTTIKPTTPNATTTTNKPTTTSPTTSKPTTTTTTTTTTKPTTPTPKPSPTPKPDDKPAINNYIGNYTGSHTICLMARLAIQVEVLGPNKTSTLYNIPKKVSSSVDCPRSDYEQLTVAWETNVVSLGFWKNASNSRYEIQSINATVLLPGQVNQTTYYHAKSEFPISDSMSYFCTKDQPLNMTDGKSNDTLAKIHLSHTHYQAFMNTTKAEYASVWNCDGANTPDVVPVVVGCVLAILVVLVLVVYLFGRQRCQARGYLSM